MKPETIGILMIIVPLITAMVVLLWAAAYMCLDRIIYDADADKFKVDWRAHGIITLIVLYLATACYLIS